jgi:chromosome segregation ATPase
MDDIFSKEGQTLEGALATLKSEFPKNAIPKEQYNTKVTALATATTELETAQTQLSETNSKIEELTNKVSDNEELKTELTAVSTELNEYKSGEETRVTEVKTKLEKRHKAEMLIRDSGAVRDSVKHLINDLDFDALSITESGDLDGFDSQLEKLKSDSPTLFPKVETVDPNGEPIVGGNTPTPSGRPFWQSKQTN